MGGDGLGSAELAAQLIGAGCVPDDLLKPPEDVLASSHFSRELRRLAGEHEGFKASAVGKLLITADIPEEDEKAKRQVVGAASDFNSKGGKMVQVEVVNGMPKASQ